MAKVSIRIDDEQKRKLEAESRLSGRKESDIVRAALDQYFDSRHVKETCLELANRIGVVDHAKDLSPDLSTKKDHFDGFGVE